MITVASISGKLVEKLHLNSVTDKIASGQSKLQRCFSTGVSPSRAALIVTELRAKARDSRSQIFLGFLDAAKAFDKVLHGSMLRKIFLAGLEENEWIMLNE